MGWRISTIALLGAVSVVAVLVAVDTPPEPDDRPDPARIAADHPAVRRLIAEGRHQLVSVLEHRPLTPKGSVCRTRCVDVLIYSYETNAVVHALVDTDRGRVLRVRRGSGQPPITHEEQQLAHTIAERHPHVRALLDDDRHSHVALASPLRPTRGHCSDTRCATVVFLLDGIAASGTGRQLHVLVDLTTRRVVEVTPQRCDPACSAGW